MESIEAKSITKGTRIDSVTALPYEVWNHTQYPSSNAVCAMLVNEYPILKDIIGNVYVSSGLTIVLLIKHNLFLYRDLGNYRCDKN